MLIPTELSAVESIADEFAIGRSGIPPIVEIDIVARMRRHAAPIRGGKIWAMVRLGPGTRFEAQDRSGENVHVHGHEDFGHEDFGY